MRKLRDSRLLSRPVRRNLVLLFVPWALLILVLMTLLYDRLLNARLEPLLRDQQNSLSEGVGVLSRHLATLRGNLRFLIQQPLFAEVLENPSAENHSSLTQLFVEFSRSSAVYDQIRWLDEQGSEQVRIDWRDGEPRVRDQLQLQNQAQRYYFVETMNLPDGAFYLSRFDLNEESGVIEQPLKPTLRSAAPIFDKLGKRRGILILNYQGQVLLQRLAEVSKSYGNNLTLVDAEGYWMFAADKRDAWGFALGRPEATLASRFPNTWRRMQAMRSGVFSDHAGYWAFNAFDPYQRGSQAPEVSERWLLVSHLPLEQVEVLQWQVAWQVLLFAGVMLSLGLVGVLSLGFAEFERDQVRLALEFSSLALQQSNGELRDTVEQLQRTRGALLQAEKLSSLGTLVAGVAHELNTPIGAASMAASTLDKGNQSLQKSLREGLQRSVLERFVQRNDEGLAIILKSLTRMAQLTRAFKQLASDRASTEGRRFDLVELVQEVMLLFTPRLKQSQHQVVLELPPSVQLDSYPGPLGQILQNLIDNALVHAFDSGMNGVITVRVEHDRGRRECVIEVSDNGCGMSEEVLSKIFDPFFTTRRGRGGTGLGLYITHQLAVDILGAELQVRSAPGQGTKFRLRLPLA
ncbi:sensor histidine kinase [Pseudomonas leptonychotis]|uniref:sensor histidine kinase n=1 Tax=Pseudomonas leptonychotis TaxID=2448482 RepID=UPI0039F144EF